MRSLSSSSRFSFSNSSTRSADKSNFEVIFMGATVKGVETGT